MFQQLLKVAAHCQLPVIIHCRERRGKFRSPQRPARELCLKHMVNELSPNHPVMIHSFAGKVEDFRIWEKYFPSVYFSLGGVLLTQAHTEWMDAMERNLVPSSTPVHAYRGNAHRLVESLDLERILIETDSPYLPPPGFPSMNTPSNITEIAEYIAQVKNIPARAVLRYTLINTKRLFDV